MEQNVDLITVIPSKHLPKGELDQLVIDKSSLNESLMGSNQKGAHGLVVSVNTNAMTLEKIQVYRGYRTELLNIWFS